MKYVGSKAKLVKDIKSDVLEFIEKFKFSFKKELEYIFTSGNCYYFSLILKERFKGEIYYLPIANHFICKIDAEYYDITGVAAMNEKPISWDSYKATEIKNAQRVERECVYFVTRKNRY